MNAFDRSGRYRQLGRDTVLFGNDFTRHHRFAGMEYGLVVDPTQLGRFAAEGETFDVTLDNILVLVLSHEGERCQRDNGHVQLTFREGIVGHHAVFGGIRYHQYAVHDRPQRAAPRQVEHGVVHHDGRGAPAVEVDHVPGAVGQHPVGYVDTVDAHAVLREFGGYEVDRFPVLRHAGHGAAREFVFAAVFKVVVFALVQFPLEGDAGVAVEGLQDILGRGAELAGYQFLRDSDFAADSHTGQGIAFRVAQEEHEIALGGLQRRVRYLEHLARGRLTVDNPVAERAQLDIPPLGIEREGVEVGEEHAVAVGVADTPVELVDGYRLAGRQRGRALGHGEEYRGRFVLCDSKGRATAARRPGDEAVAGVEPDADAGIIAEEVVVEGGTHLMSRPGEPFRHVLHQFAREVGHGVVRLHLLDGIVGVGHVDGGSPQREGYRFVPYLDVLDAGAYFVVFQGIGHSPVGSGCL